MTFTTRPLILSRFLLKIAPLLLVICFTISCSDQSGAPFDVENSLQAEVSGEKAFALVEKVVAFGPRPSGSDALEKLRVFIEEELEALGWKVQRQTFSTSTPDGAMEFVNLRARYGSADLEKIFEKQTRQGLLCSHYDTKRFEGFSFVGANDAGSSTGLLLELARVLVERPDIAEEIELVFFDGEEAFGPSITRTDGLYGSKYYAKKMVLDKPSKRPRWGVLLDMIGDRDLKVRAGVQIPGQPLKAMPDRELPEHKVDLPAVRKSLDQMARWLLAASEDLGYRKHFGISSNYITDDHIPLNVAVGIPTIDIIDLEYDYWHLPGDTVDKVSAESLSISGKVSLLLVEKYLLRSNW